MKQKTNPVIYSDFPDIDVIRVQDTYYMISTTMHFMPGCDVLKSYDLMNWEFVAHVYDELENTPSQRLDENLNIYGKGMWAPSFRFHNGKFYICFAANDTRCTYLFTATSPDGPWEKHTIDGFYHDSSLFFDDDGKVYIIYGNKTLRITELDTDIKAPKFGGLNRVIAEDENRIYLGFEGCHMYKYNGKYYLFSCHWLSYGTQRKSQVCFVADSLESEFKYKTIIDDDMGFHNMGVAQGGMVDTPDGDWYAFMFQDRGAVGRVPIIMPMRMDDDFPVIESVPHVLSIPSTRPDYEYQPLNGDDDFYYKPDADGKVTLKSFWQFNHIPKNDLWSVTERSGAFRMYSGKVCKNLVQSYNTLTQRTIGPKSSGTITIDGSNLKNGDYAGIAAFQGCYGAIALTKDNGQYYLVMLNKVAKNEGVSGDFDYTEPATEHARMPLDSPIVTVMARTDFEDKKDEATFVYKDSEQWQQLGITHKLYFKLDHFTGCRFGLFLFSTEQTGGSVDFTNFKYYTRA